MLRLQAADLSKAYRGRKVVDEVSLDIHQGEVVGLLGPNGAGKTTTFYILVGLARPDYGRVLLDGEDITDLPMYLRARSGISYLPQEPSVFRKLTVEANLMAVLETLPLTPEQRRDRVEELLAQMGLDQLDRGDFPVANHLRHQAQGGGVGHELQANIVGQAFSLRPAFSRPSAKSVPLEDAG